MDPNPVHLLLRVYSTPQRAQKGQHRLALCRAMVRQRVSAGTRRACSMGKLCAYGGNVCNICSFRPYKLMLSENHLHLKFLEEGKNIDLCSLWTVFSPPALAARGVEWQVFEATSRGVSRLVLATCSVQQAQRSAF